MNKKKETLKKVAVNFTNIVRVGHIGYEGQLRYICIRDHLHKGVPMSQDKKNWLRRDKFIGGMRTNDNI